MWEKKREGKHQFDCHVIKKVSIDCCVFHLVSGGRQGSVMQCTEKGGWGFAGALIWQKRESEWEGGGYRFLLFFFTDSSLSELMPPALCAWRGAAARPSLCEKGGAWIAIFWKRRGRAGTEFRWSRLFFVLSLIFWHWRQLMLVQAGRRSPPKPAPCYANQGRAHTIYSNFPVSLLSLLGGVDHVMLQLSWCLALFAELWWSSRSPFWGEKGVPAKCTIPKALPSFPLVSVWKIQRKYQPIPNRYTELGYNSSICGVEKRKCKYPYLSCK